MKKVGARLCAQVEAEHFKRRGFTFLQQNGFYISFHDFNNESREYQLPKVARI